MLNIISIGILLSGLFLVLVGIIFLKRWNTTYKESLFYWGFGLLLWGFSKIIEFSFAIELISRGPTSVFIMHYLMDLAFVFFLLYGTLRLILKKRQANIITSTYFVIFFFTSALLGGLTNNGVLLNVWHNILFITPPSLVSGVYYFY